MQSSNRVKMFLFIIFYESNIKSQQYIIENGLMVLFTRDFPVSSLVRRGKENHLNVTLPQGIV